MDADNPAMESGSTAPAAPASADPVSMFEAALGRSFGEAPAAADPALAAAPGAPAAEDPPSEDPPEDPPEVRTFKVKIDGQEIEVAEDELLRGYSRQQDYTKKTMELAQQRQQVDQVAAQAQAERAQYQSHLQQLAAALGEQLSAPPDMALLDSDPVEYMRQQHLYTQRQAAYQNAQLEIQRNEHQTRQQQEQAMQRHLATEREQLIANLPEWADDAKAAADKAEIVKDLAARGFTPEQIAQIGDHRAILMAREAMLYRQMIAKAKETTKKVEALPPRMQKPGATPKTTDGRTVDMQALKRSGKVDDAAALFAKML